MTWSEGHVVTAKVHALLDAVHLPMDIPLSSVSALTTLAHMILQTSWSLRMMQTLYHCFTMQPSPGIGWAGTMHWHPAQ